MQPPKTAEIMKAHLRSFALNELKNNIIPYWIKHSPDNSNGGFIGEISSSNQPVPNAPKGLILNSRILWTLSACYKRLQDDRLKTLADRAYEYLLERFLDRDNQGFFWSLDAAGNPLDTKKQTYAQAFTIYGLSEYFSISGNPVARDMAVGLFYLMEEKCLDRKRGGYEEAFTLDWKPMDDMRLSDKDMNEAKTMNTHLHVLEAYVNLYRVWDHKDLDLAIRGLLDVFVKHFVNHNDNHLNLFFDSDWNIKSDIISYGHDIEASWLMYEAAEVLGDKDLMNLFAGIATRMANVSMEGLVESGAMIHEWHRGGKGEKDEELEWWTQAEAVVGFYNAYQLSDDSRFLEAAYRMSEVIAKYIVNKEHGEWYYRVTPNGEPIDTYPNVGFWKCPYHNGRACMELTERLHKVLATL